MCWIPSKLLIFGTFFMATFSNLECEKHLLRCMAAIRDRHFNSNHTLVALLSKEHFTFHRNSTHNTASNSKVEMFLLHAFERWPLLVFHLPLPKTPSRFCCKTCDKYTSYLIILYENTVYKNSWRLKSLIECSSWNPHAKFVVLLFSNRVSESLIHYVFKEVSDLKIRNIMIHQMKMV